jgi:hypothetical protein
MNKKYVVKLTAEERASLHHLICAGKAAARKLLHARIWLKADASPDGPGWIDEQISEALEVSPTTIGRVRQPFVEQSLTAALQRCSPCGYRPRRLDGEAEAPLIALAGSPAPAGHARLPDSFARWQTGGAGVCRAGRARNRSTGAEKNERKR